MAEGKEICFVMRGTDVLVDERSGEPGFSAQREAGLFTGTPLPLGDWEGTQVFAAAAPEASLPDGFAFRPVRSLLSELPERLLHLMGCGLALVEFAETHRFCGRCGRATVEGLDGERARACPACTLTFYPRIPPAVIVLVERDDSILLARGPRFPPGRFGAVAGFVEIGETLEEAVQREVAEEVGVTVEDVRYFASQPWPYGRSLMVGFRARHAGGEICPDGKEIAEAAWFRQHELPQLPPKISMARKLIDAHWAEKDAAQGTARRS